MAYSVATPSFYPTLQELAQVEVPESFSYSFSVVVCSPSTGQRRQVYKALEVLNLVLAERDPRSRVLGAMLEVKGASKRGDRPTVLAHVLEVLVGLPAGTRLATEQLVAAKGVLPEAERGLVGDDSYPTLLVTLPGGAVVFVEAHPARHAGGTDEAWMNARCARNLAVGAYLPGFSGVLVFTVRGPAAVHVSANGARHGLGRCDVCAEVA